MNPRTLVRRLLGDELDEWRVDDVRASSGVRVTYARGDGSGDGAQRAVIVLALPGGPGFVTLDEIAASLAGAPDRRSRRLTELVTARLRERAAAFAPGELRAALADAAHRHLPVAAGDESAGAALRPLAPVAHAELRLNLACNQGCFFCNCSVHAPGQVPSVDAAVAEVRRLAAAGIARLTVTGGEPTLVAGLVEVIAAARDAGLAVGLQTNAVRLADGDLAARLAAAGLGEAFVSLHSMHAGVSDAITREPGTHARTLAGVDALAAAGVAVVTNFVINRLNLAEPPEHVRWLRARFPRLAGRVFSFMAPVGAGARNLALIPPMREAMPPLTAALDDCAAHGERARVAGLCGVPLCLLGPAHAAFSDEAENPLDVPLPPDRDRPDARCAPCAERRRCSGVWRAYLDRFGDGELTPIAPSTSIHGR